MGIQDFLGLREFYSEDEIIKFVETSKNYNSAKEKLDQARALKIFQTSKQQTWLISTKERLYNILDDIEYSVPHISWSIPRTKIESGIAITTRSYKEKFGLVTIASHKNWIYSYELFKDSDIKKEIIDLISKTMQLSLT